MLALITASLIFGSLVALAALVCGTIVLLAKSRGGGEAQRSADREEARIIREVYKGLEQMEKRLEALEVILCESKNAQTKNTERADTIQEGEGYEQ